MKPFSTIQYIAVLLIATLLLHGCGHVTKPNPVHSRSKHAQVAPIRIKNINRQQGGQELMLYSLSLIGTPYRYGGSDRSGFDCSGMVQYVYWSALKIKLPRTARDIAAAARPIDKHDLQVGDLVFFNTSGQMFSHMGLYIGQDQFIHAPSSNGVIRTAKLSDPYFRQHFTAARTLFAY